jgi:hypothetical protein
MGHVELTLRVSAGLYAFCGFLVNHNSGGMLSKICDQKYVCVCCQEFTIEIAQITAAVATGTIRLNGTKNVGFKYVSASHIIASI